jgi:hypothetical protein
MTYPTFTNGQVLPASDLNAIGLWLVKSQAVGSGVSSVTLTGAFSTDYTSYKIVYSGGTASTNTQIGLKLGATATGYYGGLIYNNVASPTPAGIADNNATSFSYSCGGNAIYALANLDIHNPFLATYTMVNSINMSAINFGTYSGYLANTTSYTDFTLTPASGTLTGGTVCVYGYRK